MIKKIFYIILVILLVLPVSSDAANKMWWATGLTGGGNALDGIAMSINNGVDGKAIVGDGAIVVVDSGATIPVGYFYRLYDSGTVVNPPIIITPATNPANLRWHQIQIRATSFLAERTSSPGSIVFYESIPDGDYTGIITAPSTADGGSTGPYGFGYTAHRTYPLLDGNGPLLIGGAPLTIAASCTIGIDCDGTSKRIAWGGTIFVTAEATITLPEVVVGMKITIYSKAGTGVITIVPNAVDGISLNGLARKADGVSIRSPASPASGDFICLEADSTAGWTTTYRLGTWQ